MKQFSLPLVMCGTVIALLATACSSTTRTSLPEVDDIYWPYAGIDATFTVSCEENRDLFAYDPNAPLDIHEGDSYRSMGVTVTDLTYASPMGGRVPATLVIPDGAGPFAGLLVQHGMGSASHPDARKTNLSEAEVYARMGALVILIDAPFNRPEHEGFQSLKLTEQDRREQIQYIIDLRRAVDLLLSQPEVDPQRLAYVGFSGGGAMGGLFAGVEDRLQGYVLIVGDGGLVTHITGPEDFSWWEIKPKEVRQQWIAWMWPIEPIHYVHCTAPAALLFQNGTLDESVSIPDALRYQQAGSEPKTVLWYKASHSLGQEAYFDRMEWLKDLIGLASYQTFPQSVEIALIVWLLLTMASLTLLVRDLWWVRPAPRGVRLLWLLTTVFLGPLGYAAYLISNPRFPVLPSPPQRALGSAAWVAAGNITGGIIVLGLLIYLPQVFGNNLILQITVLILVPLFIGWLIFAISKWLSRSDDRYLVWFRRPIFSEMVSTCLVLTGAYPTVVLLGNTFFAHWLGPFGLDLSYPPLWGALCLATLAGTLVTYPFNLWMIRRGVICWGFAAGETPVKKLAWYLQIVLILLALAVMIASIMLSIQLSAQNV